MAKDNSSPDPNLELQSMVLNFLFVAKKEDTEIDKLMVRAKTNFKEAQLCEGIENLSAEIGNLKRFQQLLKRDFAETTAKIRQTEEDLLLARQEIEGLSEKQAWVSKKRQELELRTLSCKKDTRVVSTSYHEDDRVNVDIDVMRKKAKETLWSWQILQGLENECHYLRPWSLTTVMMKMYGFTLEQARKEEEALARFEEALALALENHKDLTSTMLSNEALGEKKAKIDTLLRTIIAITNSSEYDREVCEAWEVMIEWLYHIEWEIFFITVDLLLLASTYNQVAAVKVQESLRFKLGKLKRHKGGRVLVVVYRILTLLEGNGPVTIREEKDKMVHCKDEKEREVLSNIYQILVNQLYNMIMSLMSVLYANIGLSCSNLSKKEALIGSEDIVTRCDEEWMVIRAKIDENMASVYVIL